VGAAVVAGAVLAAVVGPDALASAAGSSSWAFADGERVTTASVTSPIVPSTAAETTAGRFHHGVLGRRRWDRERPRARPPCGGPGGACVMVQTLRPEYFILLRFSYRLG
jgi:hypothetical protein